MVESGRDPASAKREDRKATIAARARTLGLLAEEYATLLPKRPKLRGTGTPSPAHVATEMRALRAAIREMDVADKPADELKAPDIRRMLAAHGAQPAAGRLVAVPGLGGGR